MHRLVSLIGMFLFTLGWVSVSNAQEPTGLQKINHIIVIYQENWSFDGLYGKFPGAEGLDSGDFQCAQVDATGNALTTLPQPILSMDKTTKQPILDKRFPVILPVKPFDLSLYVKNNAKTGDMVHRFYQEQEQIDNGKMDKFVEVSDNGGLVLSYYDASQLPEGRLANDYTLCDHYFQGAFGGSLLNHIFFITADTLTWKNAPDSVRAKLDAYGKLVKDGFVSPEGYLINNCQSENMPHNPKTPPGELFPASDLPTIGDRLSDKNVTWAWYAEDFHEAVNAFNQGKSDEEYEYHHQPFIYFKKYATAGSYDKVHLKDEDDFLHDLQDRKLPSVSWIKASAPNDEHPGYADLAKGQQHVADLVQAIQQSAYWKDSVIIITYDDHGGRFDHVPPPQRDWLGPGVRLPLIVVSPFAKRTYIDKTVYDSSSILKLITARWDLKPLNERVERANILNCFDFTKDTNN
jgi:phospholipase C